MLIRTKFLGPTDRQGARIRVRVEGLTKHTPKTYPYPHEFDSYEAHIYCAARYIKDKNLPWGSKFISVTGTTRTYHITYPIHLEVIDTASAAKGDINRECIVDYFRGVIERRDNANSW